MIKSVAMRVSVLLLTMAIMGSINAAVKPKKSIKPNTLDAQPFTPTASAIVVYRNAAEFSIKVKSNKTTGFGWYLTDYNTHFIVPMSQKFYPSQSKLVGAPGYEVWVFKVLPGAFTVPHLLPVSLDYARPFDMHQRTHQVFSIVTSANQSSV